MDLVNGNVTVHTVKGGEIDLTTPEGRFQARMLGTLARYESEHRSDRVRRKMDANAEAGIAHGGPRPYGWNPDGTLDPAEAEIVAELTRRVISGESIRALAADLRTRQVPSSRGAAWHPNAVKAIVLRPRNAGLREHRGQVVGAGMWPAIVDRECVGGRARPADRSGPPHLTRQCSGPAAVRPDDLRGVRGPGPGRWRKGWGAGLPLLDRRPREAPGRSWWTTWWRRSSWTCWRGRASARSP